MASALAEQIQCSVCLDNFSDPVGLPCEHFFCRQCIMRHLQTNCSQGATCPECRRRFNREDIRASRLLRNMVEFITSHLEELNIQQDTNSTILKSLEEKGKYSAGTVCPVHEEKLKLFCDTDKTLICLVCRDTRQHWGHWFTGTNEAVERRKEKVKQALKIASADNQTVDKLIQSQLSEMNKTKEKSKALSAHVSGQFEKMHNILEEKEKQVKERLENATNSSLKAMKRNLTLMETALTSGVEHEMILFSASETSHPALFLQWWSESGKSLTKQLKRMNVSKMFFRKSNLKDFNVTTDCLSSYAYETYMHVFGREDTNVGRDYQSEHCKLLK